MSEAIRELVAPSIIGLYKTEVIRTLSWVIRQAIQRFLREHGAHREELPMTLADRASSRADSKEASGRG